MEREWKSGGLTGCQGEGVEEMGRQRGGGAERWGREKRGARERRCEGGGEAEGGGGEDM